MEQIPNQRQVRASTIGEWQVETVEVDGNVRDARIKDVQTDG
jgi:hypothetical protein